MSGKLRTLRRAAERRGAHSTWKWSHHGWRLHGDLLYLDEVPNVDTRYAFLAGRRSGKMSFLQALRALPNHEPRNAR